MSCVKPGSVSASDRAPPPMVDSASRIPTDLPAPARTRAAANPLGPEPTTTASSGLLAKVDDGALGGGVDRDGVAPMGRHDGIDLVIGPRRIVVIEQQPLDPCGFGETDRILDGRVPERRKRRELTAGQLGIVD